MQGGLYGAHPTTDHLQNLPELNPTTFDVFLTHNWGDDESKRDNHARVALINDALQKEKITTWFDDERLEGDIVQQMTSGIDNSKIVIVFLTRKYIDKVNGKGDKGASDNCKCEFDYTTTRKTPAKMIPVVMEKDVRDPKTWDGAVGFSLSKLLYYDFTEDDKLDSCIKSLKREIARNMNNS